MKQPEIKNFRAWSGDGSVIGKLTITYSSVIVNKLRLNEQLRDIKPEIIHYKIGDSFVTTDPEDIMFGTGWIDKNGKEVFDRDKVLVWLKGQEEPFEALVLSYQENEGDDIIFTFDNDKCRCQVIPYDEIEELEVITDYR